MNTHLPEPQAAPNARDVARQIWLAGLGAFARTQQESGRFFESLVEEGRTVDQRLKKAAEQPAGREVDRMKGGVEVLKERVGEIRDQATGTWNKLEEVFQARVTRALGQLGVPTQEEVRLLRQQVDRLTENIQKLTRAAEAGSTSGREPGADATRPTVGVEK
jgi:poly(hydroxyalkanoate) granule-associated protein